MFEWNEGKRQATLVKHGIDFIDAVEIFGSEHLLLTARSETENRQIAVGNIGGITIAVVFTMRGAVTRLITARRARRNEREAYEAQVVGRDPPNEG